MTVKTLEGLVIPEGLIGNLVFKDDYIALLTRFGHYRPKPLILLAKKMDIQIAHFWSF